MSMQTSSERPTWLTVISVLGMVFGTIGVVFTPFSLLIYFVKIGPPNPVVTMVKGDSFLFAWTIGSAVVGVLLSLLLAVGSLLAYRLKPVARKLLMTYAIAAIVSGVLAIAVNAFVMLPRLLLEAKSSTNPTVAAGAIGGAIGGGVGGLFGMILPIAVLIAVFRPEVKRALGHTL